MAPSNTAVRLSVPARLCLHTSRETATLAWPGGANNGGVARLEPVRTDGLEQAGAPADRTVHVPE